MMGYKFENKLDISRIGVIFHVENFAKIRKVDVNISGYTLFVGHNNSGKTMLMQLIYGILDAFTSSVAEWDEIASDIFDYLIPANKADVRIDVNAEFYCKIQNCLNKWLDQHIEEIIFKTFRHNIEIGKISCEICPSIGEYKIEINDSKPNQLSNSESRKIIVVRDSYENLVSKLFLKADVINSESIKLTIWAFVYRFILRQHRTINAPSP